MVIACNFSEHASNASKEAGTGEITKACGVLKDDVIVNVAISLPR